MDQVGLPLFYPNLFVTKKYRNKGQAADTLRRVNYALKSFLSWQELRNIDVINIVIDGGRMRESDVSDLMQYLGYSKDTREKLSRGIAIVPGSYKFRDEKNTNGDRKYITEYIAFLIERLHPSVDRGQIALSFKDNVLREYRTKQFNKKELETNVDEKQFELINEAIEIDSSLNPFRREKIRNKCIVKLMKDLGLRRGEVANLLLNEVDFTKSCVKVRRKQDDPNDPRIIKPNAKTRERTLHMNADLRRDLYDYIEQRSNQRSAVSHRYLFTTQNGKPISSKQIYNIILQLRAIEGVGDVHPHLFRHYFNHALTKQLRKEMASSNITSPADRMNYDARRRSYLNGWSETSSMQQHYGRQWISELADSASVSRVDCEE